MEISIKQNIRRSGFTLLELIVVMAVLGALASIVMVQFPSSQRRARDSQRLSDLRQYQSLLEVYANSNNGNYPSTGTNLSSVCGSDLNSTVCPTPPRAIGTYTYSYDSANNSYLIYVELEQRDDSGDLRYHYFCSNGNAGETTTDPSSTNPC